MNLRRASGLPSLRGKRVVLAIVRSWSEGKERGDFRLLHYSIQRDHVHLIVEADDAEALGRGMMALGIRLAKAANRVWRRTGKVVADRYHVHRLTSPREVRNALVYVLQSARKHGLGVRGRLDPASSARFFEGWADAVPAAREHSRVALPRNWLIHVGWLRHGRIRTTEAPVH